jgi:hypothetical protein
VNLDAIEPVRIAFRALAPRRGSLPDDDRRDTERTVVEVQDVGVQAEGLKESSVHEPILPFGPANYPKAPGATTDGSAAPAT